MTVKVWSEREPGRWDECTESAYLMTLLFGGFTRFPLGAYTDAERDALEVAAEGPVTTDTGSTFPIIDRGSLKRYGVRLRQISDGTSAGLRARLNQTGRALAMAGSYSRLAMAHPLRRWQPSFTGGHAVCVIPLGGDRVLWLDPLAPMGYAGDQTDVNTAMAFAFIPNDAREALPGEFTATMPDAAVPKPEDKRMNVVRDINRFPEPRPWKTKPAVINGYDGRSLEPAKSLDFATRGASGASAAAIVEISGDAIPLRDGEPYRYIEVVDGFYAGLYVPLHSVEIDTAKPVTDCAQEVQKAVDPLYDRIDSMKVISDEANKRIQNG